MRVIGGKLMISGRPLCKFARRPSTRRPSSIWSSFCWSTKPMPILWRSNSAKMVWTSSSVLAQMPRSWWIFFSRLFPFGRKHPNNSFHMTSTTARPTISSRSASRSYPSAKTTSFVCHVLWPKPSGASVLLSSATVWARHCRWLIHAHYKWQRYPAQHSGVTLSHLSRSRDRSPSLQSWKYLRWTCQGLTYERQRQQAVAWRSAFVWLKCGWCVAMSLESVIASTIPELTWAICWAKATQ